MRPNSALTATLSGAVGLVLAATTLTVPADAAPGGTAERPRWTTVAKGLDNPRLLSWSKESLYVAESGRGGRGPCIPNPEDPTLDSCLGATGAVTRVTPTRHGRMKQRRVVTGLPSLADASGEGATGPSDVVVKGRRYWITMGLGGTTDVRDGLGPRAKRLGTLVAGSFKGGHGKHRTRAWSRIATDLAAFEARYDPDGEGNDSNPTGLASVRGGLAVTDSGGNDLLFVDRASRTSLIEALPTRMVPAPPFLPPGEIPMQPVPTSVVQGPDGAYYVSELTGFPFPKGEARVWRIPGDGSAPTVHAEGLTNVTDLAWYEGALYVVQLADEGLLSAEPPALPQGSLRRISPDGSSTVVAEGLPAPYGVAFKGSSAYVTTCSVCDGKGAVVRIFLP